jgi:hypothetical protein
VHYISVYTVNSNYSLLIMKSHDVSESASIKRSNSYLHSLIDSKKHLTEVR